MGGGGGGSGGAMAVFLLFLLLGGGMVVFGFIFHRRGNARFAAAGRWMRTDGLVKMARVDTHNYMANGTMQTSYRAQALYTYQAGGTQREGTRVFLVARSDWTTRSPGEAWLATCPAGATVPVWYDPANPADSAMILNKPSLVMAIVLCGVGAFLLLAGLFVLFRMAAG